MNVKSLLLLILICLSVHFSSKATDNIPKVAPLYLDISPQSARQYCDSSPLDNVEGIWNFIDDGVEVLIRAVDDSQLTTYEIISLKSRDKSLRTGAVIGYMIPTADSSKFRMFLYTKTSGKGILSPKECAATLSEDKYSISVKSQGVKIKLNLIGLLPRFWRLIKMQIDNPAGELPKGFIKTYPSYDGNGSSLREPRYL